MVVESTKLEDLGYYILGYNNDVIICEKLCEYGMKPYFKRITIRLDKHSIIVRKCYITDTKWELSSLDSSETDAVNKLILGVYSINEVSND